jgi:hypothetical protein
MKNIVLAGLALIGLCFFEESMGDHRYGERLCNNPDYECIKVKPHDSWDSLFSDSEQMDIVKRVNRMNVRLQTGMTIAVPKNLMNLTIYDVAPFPRYIEAPKEKTIYVNQKELAWAAYNEAGELVWWGPISVGRSFCPDIKKSCETPSGNFRMIHKNLLDCESTKFPLETMGGAPMPYCMFFFSGYALHGSPIVPGYADSHGCVRLFVEDAKWLNQHFVDVFEDNKPATRVIVGPPADNTQPST